MVIVAAAAAMAVFFVPEEQGMKKARA